MTPEAWLFRRSLSPGRGDIARLQAASARLGVCLLSRNSTHTLGRHILLLRHGWPGGASPWHEIIVADLGSTDGSQEIARENGARLTEPLEKLVASIEAPADGDGLARALEMTESDILLVAPADLVRLDMGAAAAMVAALVDDPTLSMCMAASQVDGGPLATLGARPVLAALIPELAVVADPTTPLFAVRTSALREAAIARTGGFECALVAEFHRLQGLACLGQVRTPPLEWIHQDPRLEPGHAFRSVLALLESLRTGGRISIPQELGHLLPRLRDWTDDGPRILTTLEVFPWKGASPSP